MPSAPAPTDAPVGSVVEAVARWAAERPDATALVAGGEEVSYARLWACARSFSALLGSRGVSAGDRVALHATHTLSYVAAYLGTTLAGAVAVPYEEGMPEEGVAELVRRVGAACVVGPLPACQGALALEPDVAASGSEDVAPDGPAAPLFPAPGDLAELLLTTGTTGRSKVVELTHGAVMAVIRNISEATGIQGDNVSLVPMPLNHVFALRRLQTGLVAGATVVLVNGVASLKRVFGAIRDRHVTSLALVPSALAYIERTTRDFLGSFDGQIRFVESSSAPLPAATRAWLRSVLPSARLYNSYGCTESTACCMLEYSHRDDDGACVGAPCATARIKILDPATGAELAADGEAGRVAIGGGAVMRGYWGDAEATAATLRDGYVYTNDLGFMRDGELYVRGRIDDVAIIGGHNVSPVEVEDVIARCPLVEECACVKDADPITGDALALFVVWSGEKDGRADDAREGLTRFMREHLEPFKIPATVRSLDAIPRTYNGKVDRKPLVAALAGDGAGERAGAAPAQARGGGAR